MNPYQRVYVFYPLLSAQARARAYRRAKDPANWPADVMEAAQEVMPNASPGEVRQALLNTIHQTFADLDDDLAAGWLHRLQVTDRLYIAARRTGQDHPF